MAAATAGLGTAAGLGTKTVGYLSKGASAANTWVSSGGNAYNAARREGKSETEARNYAIMIGGLEAGLQYALSGVSRVGGQLSGKAIETFTKNINNAYLQLAARLGMSMISEGTEEYLQEILEPVVRNVAFGENNEFKLYTKEALYAFALGAVSAGLLEGVDTGRQSIGYARTGSALNRFGEMREMLLTEALKLSPNTEAYKMAKDIVDGKLRATDHNVGELYYEAIRAGVNLDAVYQAASEEMLEAMVDAQEAVVDEVSETKKAVSGEETTGVNTDPADHTAAEQAVIDEYQGAVDKDLVSFYENAKGDQKASYSLKPVSERAAADIVDIIGLDVAGYKTTFDARQAVHIKKGHGPEGKTDQSMADSNDVGRIQYVLDNYDSVEDGGTTTAYWETKDNGHNRKAKTVVFSKKVNGTYYVVEAAPVTKAKSLYIVSAYMQKNGTQQRLSDAKAPQFTSKTSNVDSVPLTNSIPEGGQNSNRENVGKGETAAKAVRTVYDEELGAEVPAGITDMAFGVEAYNSLFENDPVLQELEAKVQSGEITPEKASQLRDERYVLLAQAFEKANPALFGKGKNTEGVTENGTEGNGVSDGSGQRHDGTGAGEQTGRLDGRTGKATGRIAEQLAKAGERRAAAKNLRKVSAKSLNVELGTQRESLAVLPEESYDEELQTVSEKIEKETGRKPIFVLGSIEVETKRGVKKAKGVILADGTVIIQADHSRYTAEQIADHELFHHKSSLNLLSVPAVVRQIREKYTREEFDNVLEQYLRAYAGLVDIPENADAQTVEDAWNRLYEEILADAHAGINAFGAEKFSDTVSEYMVEQEGSGTEQTAAATERTTGPPRGDSFSMAGDAAETADIDALQRAMELEKLGAADDIIRQETGWFRGDDGKWRFEIDDSQMEYRRHGDAQFRQDHPEYVRQQELMEKFLNGTITEAEHQELLTLNETWGREQSRLAERVAAGNATLQNLIEHDAFFAAYPELRNARVVFGKLDSKTKGSYDRNTNTITIREDLRNAPESTLLHEIQHAVQNIEGFAGGSSVEYWQSRIDNGEVFRAKDGHVMTASELYEQTAGENEAGNVASRRKLSADERKNTPPKLLGEDAVFAEGDRRSAEYVGKTKDGRRVYETSFPEGMPLDDKIDTFKKRIATIFNLGAVTLKTDTKKIVVKGDKFTANKNLYGDKRAKPEELAAKINALYDMADILQNAKFVPPAEPEDSFITNNPPKNKAHKDVKYWYKFKTNIVMDGEGYEVTFNIRDKGKDQYDYLIDFKKDGTSGISNTAVSDLLRAHQMSHDTSIRSSSKKNNPKNVEEQNFADNAFSVDVDEDTAETAVEDVETTEAAPVGEEAALERVLQRLQDPAYVQQQYAEGGFAAVQKAATEVKKLQAKLDKLRGVQKPKQPKKDIKPVAESKPIIAKNDLKKTVLDMFSIPQWRKKELESLIDGYAEQVLRNGRLTEADRKAFFDKLYASGLVTAEADEYLQTGREAVVGRKIYASDSVKAEFGEDWNAFRKRAFAAGVYLVNDSGRLGVDVAHMELAEILPGLFDASEYDQRIMLERIVEVAEEGKESLVSLDEYAAQLAGQHIITEDEFLNEMEDKLDAALKTFAEKAELEVYLRDRTGIVLAKEREARREAMQQQREAKVLKEEQQRTLKNLQWLKKNWRSVKPEDLEAGKLPPELQKTWEQVLSDIDLHCTVLANQTRYSAKYDATWQELHEMYKAAQEKDPNFLPSKDLDRIVDRVSKEKLAEMDPETLQNLLNAVLAVRHAYSERNKVMGDMEHGLFSEAFRDTKSVFGELKRQAADKISKKKGFFEKQLSDENKLLKLCGGDTNSSFWKMTQQLVTGERKMNWYRTEAYGRIQKFMDSHKKWLEGADGQGKNGRWLEVEIPECLSLEVGKVPEFGKTHKIFMTELQRVHLYLESKGEDNLRHMLGGRTFCNRSLYQQGLTKDAWSRDTIYKGGDNSNANRAVTIRLAPETVKAIVKDMTPEEMELAKLLEDYYNTFAKKEINKVSQVLYGFDKAMGRYYAPIRTNSIFTKSEPGIYDETAAGVGHMKDRMTGSKNPSLNLSALDSFMRHVDDTSRFVGMAIPARNWNSFTNWQTFADGERSSTIGEIEKAWGKNAKNQLDTLLVELQGSGKEPRKGMQAFTDWAYRQHVKAIFAGNVSSVLKQFGSYFMGSGVLDLKTMPKTVVKKYDRKLIDRYTHTLKMREDGDYRKEISVLTAADDWTQKNTVTKFIFGGAMTKADTLTAGLLWSWAENQVAKDHPELQKGTKEQIENGESPFYQKVAEVFDEAVELSQSGDTIMRSSELRKSDSAIDRTLTMFKPDAAKGYNLLARNILIRQHLKESGGTKEEIRAVNVKIGQTALGMLMNNVWAAAITLGVSLLKGKAGDYEDEEGEKTAASVLLGFVEDVAQGMVGVLAGAEELLEVVGSLVTGERWYGIDTPGLSQVEELIEDAGTGTKGIVETLLGAVRVASAGGDLGEYWRRNWPNLVGDMAAVGKVAAKYAVGIPVDNVVSYLFKPLKHFLPGMTAEMEDWFTQPVKAELEGLTGKALETRVGNIFANRAGAGEVSDEAVAFVSGLYEQGYTGAVPNDTAQSIAVNGEERILGDAEQQTLDSVWQRYVPSTLNALMNSDRFGKLDAKTQEKVLKKLYHFAAEVGKTQVSPEHEADEWVQEMLDAESPSDWLIENTAVGGKYGAFIEAGVPEETAYRASQAIDALKPANGRSTVTDLQRCRAVINVTNSPAVQMQMLGEILPVSTFAKLQAAQAYGVTPNAYVMVRETMPSFDADGNGSYKGEEVRMCLNSIPHLKQEARAALWQILTGSKSTKNNPYNRTVGNKILEAAG